MHILFFSTMNGAPWGGSEVLWYKVALLALKENHKVSVVYKYWGDNEHSNLKTLKSLGVSVIYRDKVNYSVQESRWYTKLRHRLKMHFKIALPAKSPLIIETNYVDLIPPSVDVMCFSQGATFDLAFSNKYHELNKQLNVPYVIISQFNKDFGFSLTTEQRDKAKVIIGRSKKMFFVSKANHTFAEHQLAAKISNYAITANSLNIDHLDICNYPKNIDQPVFVSVARLDVKTKGIDLQIRCFALPIWRDRDWTYLIYGDGPDKEYFQDLIEFYDLSDKVKLCGFANDIRAVWNQGHILLQPSIAEGTPLTLQEAMFCGRPAVVTDIAGNTELIQDGVNGFVAAGPMFNALAEALERAYKHRSKWESMGYSAYETAKNQINLYPEIDLLENLLN